MLRQYRRPEFGGPRSYGAIVKPFHESVIGGMRRPMLTLCAAVGLVLLIGCVNLSNLLLGARRDAKERDGPASRRGARRARLVRQLLTESEAKLALGKLFSEATQKVNNNRGDNGKWPAGQGMAALQKRFKARSMASVSRFAECTTCHELSTAPRYRTSLRSVPIKMMESPCWG